MNFVSRAHLPSLIRQKLNQTLQESPEQRGRGGGEGTHRIARFNVKRLDKYRPVPVVNFTRQGNARGDTSRQELAGGD